MFIYVINMFESCEDEVLSTRSPDLTTSPCWTCITCVRWHLRPVCLYLEQHFRGQVQHNNSNILVTVHVFFNFFYSWQLFYFRSTSSTDTVVSNYRFDQVGLFWHCWISKVHKNKTCSWKPILKFSQWPFRNRFCFGCSFKQKKEVHFGRKKYFRFFSWLHTNG